MLRRNAVLSAALIASVAFSGIGTAAVAQPQAVAASSAAADLGDRREITSTHVDAATLFLTEDGLDIGARTDDGIAPLDDVFLSLDDAYVGWNNVARFTVPDGDMGRKLRFLGEPGDVLWHAPARYYSGWKPIWAGFGAELEDAGIRDNSATLTLVDVEGPGDVEVFNHGTMGSGWARQTFSSTNPSYRTTTRIYNDAHWHSDWTFSEAGIYRMTFKATARTTDGKLLESPERTLVWRVGMGS